MANQKHMDIHGCHAVFHESGKEGKVYSLANNPTNHGLNIAVDQFFNYYSCLSQQQSSNRDPNTGLQIGLILLDPTYRSEVLLIMKNKKDHKWHLTRLVTLNCISTVIDKMDYTVLPKNN
mmetsp:Transcript_16745/g.25986  ORF Transcript_16745/g.25986 Transcript_16745/m.25986 type:complete len:120 (-) Transcript_16745:34-393(-)